MKIRIVSLLGLAGILSLSAAACSAAAGQTNGTPTPEKQAEITGIEVSYDELAATKHISREIEITHFGILQVTLYSNQTTGYSWSETAQIADFKVLQQESHEYVAPTANRVGAGGKEVWVFKTLAPGKTTLNAAYSQPWAGGEKGEWTFELNVTVK